jgi:uncharacterized membrane protein
LVQQNHDRTTIEKIATGLGWFSIGLGVAEIIAPGSLARFIGIRDEEGSRKTLRLYGVREIASGVGILSGTAPSGWLWSRVAGDLLDLGSLGAAARSDDARLSRIAGAGAAVLGVAALDLYCAKNLSNDSPGALVQRTGSITVNRSPDEVYQFWRNFENLPRFMAHLESVRVESDRRSHWKAKGPAGTSVDWDAEIVEDQPGSFLSWRSVEPADVQNCGFVRFAGAPGGRGTIVTVEVQYSPPGGKLGSTIAKLFGEEPGQQIDQDLRRFKQVLETGEVVHSDASIHSGMHAARPADSSFVPADPQGVQLTA